MTGCWASDPLSPPRWLRWVLDILSRLHTLSAGTPRDWLAAVFSLLEAEGNHSEVVIISQGLSLSFLLNENWMNRLQSWLNICSTWGSEVSSEQSRGSLARSQKGKATLSAVSAEFTGLSGVISISGYPGSNPESIRAAAVCMETGQGLGAEWPSVCGVQDGLVPTHV